jgi:hypothetical protein
MVRRETGKELMVEVYCSEGLATHTGLRVMHHDPRGRGEAFTGVRIGWDIEPRKGGSGCRHCRRSGRQHDWARYCRVPQYLGPVSHCDWDWQAMGNAGDLGRG